VGDLRRGTDPLHHTRRVRSPRASIGRRVAAPQRLRQPGPALLPGSGREAGHAAKRRSNAYGDADCTGQVDRPQGARIERWRTKRPST
jgi:hypothetical protein